METFIIFKLWATIGFIGGSLFLIGTDMGGAKLTAGQTITVLLMSGPVLWFIYIAMWVLYFFYKGISSLIDKLINKVIG